MKKILFLAIAICILSGCENKQNNHKAIQKRQEQMLSIELIKEIKQHLKDQARIQTDEDDGEYIENPYHITPRDLELAAIVMSEGLKSHGYKVISEENFNSRIKEVFGINDLKNPHYKINVTKSYITLFGNQQEDYKKMVKNEFEDPLYYNNYFLSRTEHLFFPFPPLDYLIKINKDNSYKIIIEPYHVHRNKYLFNDDQASFAWLYNNNRGFLNMLLQKYGYDKEPKINKMLLDSLFKRNPARGQYIANLFFIKDSYNKLQIRKGLLKYVEENTSAIDNRFIYALGDFAFSLYYGDRDQIFDEDPSKKFTDTEKAEIVANIANIENPAIEKYKSPESSEVWTNAGSSLYNLSVSHPEVIKIIEEHNYFGLPKMKAIIAKLQEEAPPTGADPE